jgi:hypothetical protein
MDDCMSHGSFRDKHGLSVQLLADPEGDVCRKYGVLQEKDVDGRKKTGVLRSTFTLSSDPSDFVMNRVEKSPWESRWRLWLEDTLKLGVHTSHGARCSKKCFRRLRPMSNVVWLKAKEQC